MHKTNLFQSRTCSAWSLIKGGKCKHTLSRNKKYCKKHICQGKPFPIKHIKSMQIYLILSLTFWWFFRNPVNMSPCFMSPQCLSDKTWSTIFFQKKYQLRPILRVLWFLHWTLRTLITQSNHRSRADPRVRLGCVMDLGPMQKKQLRPREGRMFDMRARGLFYFCSGVLVFFMTTAWLQHTGRATRILVLRKLLEWHFANTGKHRYSNVSTSTQEVEERSRLDNIMVNMQILVEILFLHFKNQETQRLRLRARELSRSESVRKLPRFGTISDSIWRLFSFHFFLKHSTLCGGSHSLM